MYPALLGFASMQLGKTELHTFTDRDRKWVDGAPGDFLSGSDAIGSGGVRSSLLQPVTCCKAETEQAMSLFELHLSRKRGDKTNCAYKNWNIRLLVRIKKIEEPLQTPPYSDMWLAQYRAIPSKDVSAWMRCIRYSA